ncbi:hypothetical protein Tco_1402788 [Tanacetum coccineum]
MNENDQKQLDIATIASQWSISSATSQNGQFCHNFNELRAERMAKNANPLALSFAHLMTQTLRDPYYQSSKALKGRRDPEQSQKDKDMQRNLARIAKKVVQPSSRGNLNWLADSYEEKLMKQEVGSTLHYMAKIQRFPKAYTRQ